MAVDSVSPALAIRSSVGIELWASSGSKQPYEHKDNLPREETKNSRSISFSPDGRYFAYSNGREVMVLRTSDWQLQCSLPRPKAFYLKFSPRGNYLCTWELYVITKDIPEGSPNMFVYEMASGKEVFSIVQKKQSDWEPSWSSDESIFATVIGGEALFYDLTQGVEGFNASVKKIGGSKGGTLSVGPGNSPPFIAIYTPGAKGAPSMCKLYKYPALGQNQTVACKSFFNADRVELIWNRRGTGLLLLTSTEVDKTGASYYGNQALHFLNTKGDSCSVPLSKEGPVHCVKWSPKATEFVVVYGYMPSKAALYNLKCDVVFDFGEGPRNCAYFNSFGNLVVLAGFGNLPGNVEIWDVSKKEKLANIKCPDTTHFEWNPNGEYFVTATTAPRLRIGNGFKVYHYSGALLHETIWPQGQELLAVEWQQFADNTFKEPVITKVKHEGIKSSQPEASKKVYTPPHLRFMSEGKNPEKFVPQSQSTIPGLPPGYSSSQANNKKQGAQKSHQQQQQQQQNPKGFKQQQQQQQHNKNRKNEHNNENNHNNNGANNTRNNRGGRGGDNNNSNGGQPGANNYNRMNKMQAEGTGDVAAVSNNEQQQQQTMPQQQQQQHNKRQQNQRRQQQNPQFNQQRRQQQQQQQQHNQANSGENVAVEGQQPQQQNLQQPNQQQQQTSKKAANPEKEKKIRNVAKKLSDIKKLKARQDQGEVLELNQLNKIEMESKFLEELKALKLSA
ncbi:eukaryotic translation initiation factor 2A [Lucilia cuprina]|uniref:eukaryotic translation initiation factor 2A n=1 Tax=Lucilia cuprina TaxID=7375 RepID=UPI001F054A2C|nr:eukaryotic translation initiation factor 2A [Lucilia cuprina]